MTKNISVDKSATLGKGNIEIVTERLDDVVLLIGQMKHMGLQAVLDRHIPRHWHQRDLSWGWTAVIWLAHILTAGDHRKVSMETYIRGMKNALSQLIDQTIDPLDFSDDRLSRLLKHLNNRDYWVLIEKDLNDQSIEVYELDQKVIRCDATTVSAHHEVAEGGLVQFGHSKDDPSLPQIKIMSASLDPLGMPLASDVVSGEKADDGLYIPLIERIVTGLKKTGLLFVGDCKMSALETRGHLVVIHHYYLSPLPLTGKTTHEMAEWISLGIEKRREDNLIPVFRKNYRGEEILVARGYEFDRVQTVLKDGEEITWVERVQVINSPAYAKKQAEGLEHRLVNVKKKIEALTPPRGRGKRQISDEDVLLANITKILKTHRVEGLFNLTYERQVERKKKYVGKGRGAANRETTVVEKVRYQIIAVDRDEDKIATIKDRLGWKAFVTNSPMQELSLHDAVLSYRNEYRVERIFNRLKSRLNIAPLFVKKDEQIAGLTYLLTLGVRVLTLMEFVIQRSLKEDNTGLSGMHPENRKKITDTPSAEKILKTFSGINLTIIRDLAGNILIRSLTPLSPVQQEIIQRLNLDLSLYLQLEN